MGEQILGWGLSLLMIAVLAGLTVGLKRRIKHSREREKAERQAANAAKLAEDNKVIDDGVYKALTQEEVERLPELAVLKELLTADELKVAALSAAGLNFEGVARKMIASEATVMELTAGIYEKLGVKSREEMLNKLHEMLQ